jgi:SRSO17 transposase
MGRGHGNASGSRFFDYIQGLASVIGHADRVGPLNDYCLGLMVARGRKSVEPMAAHIAPHRTSAQHQSMLHFIGRAGWSDKEVLAKVREMVLPQIERHGPIEAWIIDDTGLPKKGEHSVGVSHQYCGQLGKQANCQVAVSLSIANHHASLPVAYQLYLPKVWAQDSARRDKAGVPEEISFQTKNEIALDHIRWACKAGLPRGNVLTDAGLGHDCKFRESITEEGLTIVPVSSRKPWFGNQAYGRVSHRRKPVITRFLSRNSPSAYRRKHGARSNGAKVQTIGYLRALHACVLPSHQLKKIAKSQRKNGY